MSLRAIDKRHLEAAEGWLGLGDWSEAIKELEKLPPQARLHPDPLCARYMAFCTAKKWDLATKDARNLCRIAPHEVGGFIALASALNFQGRTREARKVLVEVQGRFPKHYLLSFYLARFACRLGNVREARPFQSMSRAENPGNGKADKPKRYISVGVRNIIKATASGVYFLNASVGGQLFQESLKTKDLEEAKACRDARIANIRADQAEGRTGKEMPAFPHRMTGIEDVQRLAEWLEACNKRNVAVSKNEQARLLELIPASRALLRKLEMKLLFGGAGAVVRSDSDLIEAYAQANETVPLLSVGLPALPKQAGELGRCRAGS